MEDEKCIKSQDLGNELNEEMSEEMTDNCETQDEMSMEDTLRMKEAELDAMNDKYLRMLAEYDNYRKNAIKEKAAVVKYKAEALAKDVISVLDDFERAFKSHSDENVEGFKLIYEHLRKLLARHGVEEIIINNGDDFSDDTQEAISVMPVSDEAMNNKIIDCSEKGYKLHDKVIRYAKVVIGQFNGNNE